MQEKKEINVCPNHSEYLVPMISTFAFNGAEHWCPFCGEKLGMFSTGKAERTPELIERLRIYKAHWKQYLNAVGTLSCSSMEYKGRTVQREDLPEEFINEQLVLAETWESEVVAEDVAELYPDTREFIRYDHVAHIGKAMDLSSSNAGDVLYVLLRDSSVYQANGKITCGEQGLAGDFIGVKQTVAA